LRKRSISIILVLLSAAAAVTVSVLGYQVYLMFFGGIQPGPSLIEELRSGRVTAASMERVDVLRFDPGGGWPILESDFRGMERASITSADQIRDLIGLLRTRSSDGYQARNHPGTVHFGILKFVLKDGKPYYLFFQILLYQGNTFTAFEVGSVGSTNPNGGKHYDNGPLSDFLRLHDPWYGKSSTGRGIPGT